MGLSTLELISTRGSTGFCPEEQVEFKPQAEFQPQFQVRRNPRQELPFLCWTDVYPVASSL